MKKIFSVFIFLFSFVFLYALVPLNEALPLIDEDGIMRLKDGQTLGQSTLHADVKILIPSLSLVETLTENTKTEDNSFTVVITSFVEFPKLWNNLSDKEKMLSLFNILTSISTQKGTKYISRTAGYKEKTLIEESYCISDLSKPKSQILDPVFDSLPQNHTLYAYQKDNRFGKNTFVIDYQVTDNEILMKITNHTKMKFMGVTCLKEEKLNMYIDAYLTEEGIILSCLATVYDIKPKFKVLFYTVDIEDSFQRRIIGLNDWFVSELDKNRQIDEF